MEVKLDPINIFDFDGTLTTETWPKFWVWAKKYGYTGERRNDALEKALEDYRSTHEGSILETFFWFFNDLLIEKNDTLSDEELMEGEKYIKYNPGVKSFIKKSNLRNYIVSGGLKEFLEGLEIAPYFCGIYGTPVIKNSNGLITGIGEVMTDDKKIQSIQDILKKNNRVGNDCRNVFYIGDGYSDAPAMRFVHENGGKAVFVYQPIQNDELYEQIQNTYKALKSEGILDYAFVADYTEDSSLLDVLQRPRTKLISSDGPYIE